MCGPFARDRSARYNRDSVPPFPPSLIPLFRTVALVTSIVLAALCVLASQDQPQPGATDLDPRSVEWVCARAPERVRALFDSLNLERPGFESVKRFVAGGDYPSACSALVAYYRGAKTAMWLRRPPVHDSGKGHPKVDPMLADRFEFHGDRAQVPRTSSGGIEWSYGGSKNDPAWGWELSKMEYFMTLLYAYEKTGRPAYVKRIDEDTRDWILANPHPGKMTKNGPWNGINVATRARYWVQVFYQLQSVDEFSPAARILMLSSVVEHAQYLMVFHRRDDNNWTVSEVTALGIVGCAWPEFRDAIGWRAYSQEKVGQQMGALVYPDGAEAELSCGYQRLSTESFEAYVDMCRRFGHPVADSIEVGVKRMWSYLAYTLRPDGTAPENNDSDRRDLREKLIEAAGRHDRPDWTYIATNGQEGMKPRIGPSVTFPWAGQAVMRSGWDADAQWSFFDAGPFGVAHQHYDKLHVSIDAFGRALLVDAGRYYYDRSPFRDYFVSSASHNVILIDGAGQHMTAYRAERPMAGGDYGSTPEFDFARGVFGAGYQGASGRAVHTRTLVYVRERFWIVADRVETDRSRNVDVLWHFAPDCNLVIDGKTVASNDDGKGNLRVVPIGGVPWRIAMVEGADNPVQGWYSPRYTEKEPSPVAVYSAEIPGTETFAWVLLPARGEVPAVDARVLSSGEDRIELRVQVASEKAFIVIVPMNSWRPSVRREG